MADVSYLRAPKSPRRQSRPGARGGASVSRRPPRRGLWLGLGLVGLVVVVLAAVAVVFATAKAKLSSDPNAIAKVTLGRGGGTIESVSVTRGPHSTPVPVRGNDATVLPRGTVAAGENVSVRVVVKRPGWISWLSGKTETLTKTIRTPSADLRDHFVTLDKNGALRVRYKLPVAVFSYGQKGKLARHALDTPAKTIQVPHTGTAGTMYVAAEVHPWETAPQQPISWFPAGTKASAVASPAPGGQITADQPITLTFSKPVSQVLGSHRPVVSPATQGSWTTVSSHVIRFTPASDSEGYGLDQKVSIPLPSGVQLAGASGTNGASTGTWQVPAGSTTRLQQILATLGYLPLNVNYTGAAPGATLSDQMAAATKPPAGTFSWKYPNTPDALKAFWKPGSSGIMEQGAIMRFEFLHDMTADGVAGPAVWKALINAMVHNQRDNFGYTFVSVSIASQSINLWHSGKTVIGGSAVNTGAAGTPTATGTWPVFEHIPVTTMSGTNPDGSHYSDPGIQYVSYFHGGDALHAFTRAQYGFPQSLGCVEMPVSTAGQVYPYTPIGTLVHVA